MSKDGWRHWETVRLTGRLRRIRLLAKRLDRLHMGYIYVKGLPVAGTPYQIQQEIRQVFETVEQMIRDDAEALHTYELKCRQLRSQVTRLKRALDKERRQ